MLHKTLESVSLIPKPTSFNESIKKQQQLYKVSCHVSADTEWNLHQQWFTGLTA